MHRILLLIFILLLSCDIFTEPEKKAIVRIVPDEYPSIQSALDETLSGDTILVKPGVYVENIKCLTQKNVVLLSTDGPDSTIIIGNYDSNTDYTIDITFGNFIIEGFTIKGNAVSAIRCYDTDSLSLINLNITESGGNESRLMYLVSESIYISNINIFNNVSVDIHGNIIGATYIALRVGGESSSGIYENIYVHDNPGGSLFIGGNSTMSNINVYNNTGGGLTLYPQGPHQLNNVNIYNNQGENGTYHDGIYVYHTDAIMTQSLIRGNKSGIILSQGCIVEIRNVLVIGNSIGMNIYGHNSKLENVTIYGNLHDIDVDVDGTVTIINSIIGDFLFDNAFVTYSNIVDGYGGADSTNISLEPIFYNLNYPDTSLFSFSTDYTLNVESPCIDSGHPGEAYNDTDGTRNDMGAFGGPSGNWMPVNIE